MFIKLCKLCLIGILGVSSVCLSGHATVSLPQDGDDADFQEALRRSLQSVGEEDNPDYQKVLMESFEIQRLKAYGDYAPYEKAFERSLEDCQRQINGELNEKDALSWALAASAETSTGVFPEKDDDPQKNLPDSQMPEKRLDHSYDPFNDLSGEEQKIFGELSALPKYWEDVKKNFVLDCCSLRVQEAYRSIEVASRTTEFDPTVLKEYEDFFKREFSGYRQAYADYLASGSFQYPFVLSYKMDEIIAHYYPVLVTELSKRTGLDPKMVEKILEKQGWGKS